MHAKNFIVNQCCNWHAIKYILEFFPKSNAIFIFAFVVETINSINLATLMVTSQQEEVFLKFNFIRQ